MQAPESMNLD